MYVKQLYGHFTCLGHSKNIIITLTACTWYFRLDSNGDVKVGDFGLAEDVYSTGYFRQSDSERVKLPYKWLALESLNDAIFNEKTDVVRTINALNSFLMIIIEIKNATLYHALDCTWFMDHQN